MSSVCFRIEVYENESLGCPELNLMGYHDIEDLLIDCWKEYLGDKDETTN